MPVYEYTALDIKGKKASGIIDAESSFAARQKLRDSRMFPVSIKETDDTSIRDKAKTFSLYTPFVRVRTSEVSMMTRQLATLIGAGFPLVTAIDALIPQTKSHAFKKVLSQIKDSIVEGNSFAGSLSSYPGIFSSIYTNMIRAGETSGTLEVVLDRLADITERRQVFMNNIRAALAYPVFILLFACIVLFLLLAYIVPSVTVVFADMNQVLPAPTRFLIAVGDLFNAYWWLIVFFPVGMILAFQGIKRTAKGRYLMDKALLSLPGIGILVIKVAVARVSRTLGSLLENGVSMMPALDVVKNISGNILIGQVIEQASKEVGEGQGLGHALGESKIFPNLFIQMIQVGEQSGELESMLGKVADVFENEVESAVVSLVSILGPVMILIMGVVVGFIVLSICLPIFEMNRLVL